MTYQSSTILSLTLLLVASQVGAEDAPPGNDLQKQVEVLQKSITDLKKKVADLATQNDVNGVQTDLENFKYQVQRNDETKRALSNRPLTISGTVQARAGYTSRDIAIANGVTTPTGAIATSANNPALVDDRRLTFDVPTAIVGFSGLLFRDYESKRNLAYNVSFAGTPQNGALGAPAAANNQNYLSVLNANVRYELLPTIENDGDRLGVTFGQQILPFGLESSAPEDLKPVINNAQFVGGLGLGSRQIGLILSGEAFAQFDFGYNYRQALLAYWVGIVNGNGANNDDNNNSKDLIARVAITLPADYDSWLRELRIGASVYKGHALVANTAGNGVYDTGRRDRYGFDVYYNHWPLGVTYEFVRGVDDTQGATGAATPFTKVVAKDAHTVTLFYSFGQQFLSSIKTQAKYDDWWPKTWQPFLRYDRWDVDASTGGNDVDVYTAGLNVFFAETTKAQFNYNHKVQHQASQQLDRIQSDELLFQLQFGF